MKQNSGYSLNLSIILNIITIALCCFLFYQYGELRSQFIRSEQKAKELDLTTISRNLKDTTDTLIDFRRDIWNAQTYLNQASNGQYVNWLKGTANTPSAYRLENKE